MADVLVDRRLVVHLGLGADRSRPPLTENAQRGV